MTTLYSLTLFGSNFGNLKDNWVRSGRQPLATHDVGVAHIPRVNWMTKNYLGGVSNIFFFHPYLGNDPILKNMFQVGWNHQLDSRSIQHLFAKIDQVGHSIFDIYLSWKIWIECMCSFLFRKMGQSVFAKKKIGALPPWGWSQVFGDGWVAVQKQWPVSLEREVHWEVRVGKKCLFYSKIVLPLFRQHLQKFKAV